MPSPLSSPPCPSRFLLVQTATSLSFRHRRKHEPLHRYSFLCHINRTRRVTSLSPLFRPARVTETFPFDASPHNGSQKSSRGTPASFRFAINCFSLQLVQRTSASSVLGNSGALRIHSEQRIFPPSCGLENSHCSLSMPSHYPHESSQRESSCNWLGPHYNT